MGVGSRESRSPSKSALVALPTVLALVLGACTGDAEPIAVSTTMAAVTTTAPPTVATTTTTEAPATLGEVARDIATDVGVVMEVVETDSEAVIFVFEENHASVLGRVETTMMMHRLYENYGLRLIGLEGLAVGTGPLDLSWAHDQPYYEPSMPITIHEDVIIQTLLDGEISSAEMMGLMYHDLVVDGIDDAGLYAIEAPDNMGVPFFYMHLIALASMSDAERTAYDALVNQGSNQEAFDFAVGTNQVTADLFARLTDPVDIASMEEWITAIRVLRAIVETDGIDVVFQAQSDLMLLEAFMGVSLTRSEVMARTVLELATANPGAPLAMTIGAGHTDRIVELLTEGGVSLAVLRPISLAEGSTVGRLSPEAWDRKVQGLSVGPEGSLGALLDGRAKNPKPVADEPWYEFKTRIAEKLAQWASQQANGISSNVFERLEGDHWAGIELEMGDVFLPNDDNPNPVVEWRVQQYWLEGPGPDLNEAVADVLRKVLGEDIPLREELGRNRTLLSGLVRVKEGSTGKPELTVFGQMNQGRESLLGEGSTSPQPGDNEAAWETISSTTEITSNLRGE